MEKEYFIIGNTFAAPFFSDTLKRFIKAETPEKALMKFIEECTHPCGIYSANCYESADACEKNEKPLSKWLCNLEIEQQNITKDKGAYSYLNKGEGILVIDGEEHKIDNWKEGKLLTLNKTKEK